jgi:hypothetical protein
MDPGHSNSNSKSAHPSLSRRSLQPVLSQAYICDLWIEFNNLCWPDEWGHQSSFFGYCRSR